MDYTMCDTCDPGYVTNTTDGQCLICSSIANCDICGYSSGPDQVICVTCAAGYLATTD